ncbi:ribonuclease HII [Allomyces macrogynus ATCC 38327]|uniref:Ribonuclease n=1 Tax=Allomyces macrogynus (strain ATCC 38327) TaxID=578462 RepID=A0A0L0S240_ALLM3|nr:ribonuclease HII [Allomyces macrogynus ATCC 38327]|eukprot:KNE56618.1 ribonuclease HII [Allomyces macrogynus ATCC 38327]
MDQEATLSTIKTTHNEAPAALPEDSSPSTSTEPGNAATDPTGEPMSVDEDNTAAAVTMVRSIEYHSPVPDVCRKHPCVLGVDEAGRGPVLGPMVYAVCYLPKDQGEVLTEIKVDDSKVLNEEMRSSRFDLIKARPDVLGYSYNALSPQDLSEWMLRRSKYNLNAIAHNTTIALIRHVLNQGVQIDEIYVDTVGPPATYEKKLKELFPKVATITVAKKADSLYPSVSAASIVAKVTRDHYLSQWQFAETALANVVDRDWGSGYPSDPNTVKWLKRNLDPVFGWPGIIRFSWSTAENLLKEDVVVDDWPTDREEREHSIKAKFAVARAKDLDTTTSALRRKFGLRAVGGTAASVGSMFGVKA